MTTERSTERVIRTAVHGCARCGGDHARVAFLLLVRPMEMDDKDGALTHWASCPRTGEPILLRCVD